MKQNVKMTMKPGTPSATKRFRATPSLLKGPDAYTMAHVRVHPVGRDVALKASFLQNLTETLTRVSWSNYTFMLKDFCSISSIGPVQSPVSMFVDESSFRQFSIYIVFNINNFPYFISGQFLLIPW